MDIVGRLRGGGSRSGFWWSFDVNSNSRLSVYLLNMVMMIKQSMEQVPAMIVVMFDVRSLIAQFWQIEA